MVHDLAKLGITPGAEFKLTGFSESAQDAIGDGYAAGQAGLVTLGSTIQGNNRNGWKYLLQGIGAFGDHYNTRAYVANIGLGANLPEDAVYPSADVDMANQPLNSNYNYTITFPQGQTPPAQGFWSITMYDKNNFLVYNPILRYALGSYSGLVPNDDGSVTLYLQKNSPGTGKESNWLPTPQDANSPFNLKMRIYWPDPSVLNNQWEVPGVVKVN
jgi:DNA sulfur modification protein DndE